MRSKSATNSIKCGLGEVRQHAGAFAPTGTRFGNEISGQRLWAFCAILGGERAKTAMQTAFDLATLRTCRGLLRIAKTKAARAD